MSVLVSIIATSELSTTGANAAPIIGIGAVVLLAGVGLMIWARRRRDDS